MKPRGVHGVRVLCLFSELSFKHPKRRRTVYFLAESHFYILGNIQTAFLFRKTDISFTFPPLRINYILFISICQYPFHVFIGELFRDAETKARFFHIFEKSRHLVRAGVQRIFRTVKVRSYRQNVFPAYSCNMPYMRKNPLFPDKFPHEIDSDDPSRIGDRFYLPVR